MWPRAVGLCMALLVLVGAAPAVAAGPKYVSGHYSGHVQTDPALGSGRGKISFVIRKHRITKLKVSAELTCLAPKQGSGVEGTEHYTLTVPRSWRVKISRTDRFRFSGHLGSKRSLSLTGKLRGRKSTGTVQIEHVKSSGVDCAFSAPLKFSARH
jgi:hypothetical protein